MDKILTFGFFLFVCTSLVRAQIQITEVMYDPSGSDTGREWIEVQNIGSAPIDFTSWKFFEANVNHGIDQLDGYSTQLLASEYGVIVSDKTKFLLDFPSFSGKIFKSSFSLSNTGETIALKNDVGVIVDEYLYDVGLGAAGDGNSIQKNINWSTGFPTPGTGTSNSSGTNNATTTLSSTENTVIATGPATTGAEVVSNTSQLFGSIIIPQVVLAGGETLLQAKAFVSGGKNAINPAFTWNFGDGTIGYGATTIHRYKYPGTYHITLEIMATVDTVTTFALEHRSLVAVNPDVLVSEEIDRQGSTYIRLENKSKYLLDVSSWIIQRGIDTAESYVFPKNTFIAPFTALYISQDTTRFKNVGLETIKVLFPNKVVITDFKPVMSTNLVSTSTHSGTTSLALKTYNNAQSKQKVTNQTVNTGVFSIQTKENQDSVKASSTLESAFVAVVAGSDQRNYSILWYVLPILLFTIIVTVFLVTKKQDVSMEEYTIIDDIK